MNELGEDIEAFLGHTEIRQLEQHTRLVKQTKDYPLSEGRGNGGNADIDVLVCQPYLYPPILWKPLLRNVQFRHDLDSGYEGRLNVFRRGEFVVQDAVNAVPDLQLVLVGFHVDIACPGLDRLREHEIDKSDDRRVAGLIQEVARSLNFGQDQVAVLIAMHIFDDILGRGTTHLVGRVDGGEDGILGRQHGLNTIPSQDETKVIEGLKCEGVVDGDEGNFFARQRDHLVFFQELNGDVLGESGIQIVQRKVGPEGVAKLKPQSLQDIIFRDNLAVNEDLADSPSSFFLDFQGLGNGVLGKTADLNKYFTDRFMGHGFEVFICLIRYPAAGVAGYPGTSLSRLLPSGLCLLFSHQRFFWPPPDLG